MGRSKGTRAAAAAINSATNGPLSQFTNCGLSRGAISFHLQSFWNHLPPHTQNFALGNPNPWGSFHPSKLMEFWSHSDHVQCTRGPLGRRIHCALCYLTFAYLDMGMLNEASTLSLNGSFIYQCIRSSIEHIDECWELGATKIPETTLPFLAQGVRSLNSPSLMREHIQKYLPSDYAEIVNKFSKLSSNDHLVDCIGQTSDDWNETSSASRSSKHTHRHRSSSTNVGTQIKLILMDNDAEGEQQRHSFDIGSSTTLKALFNQYADLRGISLRSLRFSYSGKSLFLSSAGHKTPEELGMHDQDVIMVYDTNASTSSNSKSREPNSYKGFHQQQPSYSNKSNAKKLSNKKVKSKKKKLQQQQHRHHVVEPSKTLQEYKLHHSKQLDKVYGEVQPAFKLIRQRLNNLAIERSEPKVKSKCPRTSKNRHSVTSTALINHSNEGLGRKAGKSHYAIQVGEMQNLYKTAKSSLSSSRKLFTLDLHGDTREEATTKLDTYLKIWFDAAMRGSYPFIQPVVIVCGCGNQILSEVVQEWIKSNDNVANAPKHILSKRRGMY